MITIPLIVFILLCIPAGIMVFLFVCWLISLITKYIIIPLVDFIKNYRKYKDFYQRKHRSGDDI